MRNRQVQRFELAQHVTEGAQRIRIAHVVEHAARRKPDTHPISAPDINHGPHDFQGEARTVFHGTPVGVGTLIRAVSQKLVQQIAIRIVNLHSVELRRLRGLRAMRILGDDARKLRGIQRARRHIILHARAGKNLAIGPHRRGRDWRITVGLEDWVGNAADMPELQENQPARRMHSVGHLAPAGDVRVGENAGRVRVPEATRRNRSRLGDKKPAGGPLTVVFRVEFAGGVSGLGPAAREGREVDAVGRPHCAQLKR